MATTENMGTEWRAKGEAGLKRGHPQEQDRRENGGWNRHVTSRVMPRATSHSDQAM
jgi:hypothetical protein